MRRALVFFIPAINRTVVTVVALGIIGAMYLGARAHARMAVEAEIRAACAAELRQVEARHPFVAIYLKPADPCLALRVVRSGR